MKRMLAGFIAVGLVASAGLASAQVGTESLRFSWDGCDPIVVNKDFGAPGNYLQVVSGVGWGGQYRGQQVEIVLGPGPSASFPDAWRFDATGCQTGQITFSPSPVSKVCPSLQGTNPLALTQFALNVTGDPANTARISLANTFDTFVGTAATRYTLWQITYNHAFSVAGPDPVNCGNADQRMCFVLNRGLFLNESDLTFDVPIEENQHLTWNDAANTLGCPSVPTVPKTWGQIKKQYH